MTTSQTGSKQSARSVCALAWWGVASCVLATSGCYSAPAVDRPIVRQADDRRPILDPQEETEGQWALWDGTDKMIFYRIGQLFNLGRSFRTIGTWLSLADPIEPLFLGHVAELAAHKSDLVVRMFAGAVRTGLMMAHGAV